MQKSFDITIDDQQPINPNNSFAIYRGDNVAFNFTFQRGGISLDVDGATLRVFAKKIGKNGAVDKLSLPLFAEDFVATNTATFNSSQTCGDAGNYILSVLLVSSDDAVITSQCIYFELKENGYAGEYQPSADFRDEVLSASELAQQSSESAQASAINAQQSESNASASESNAKQSEANAKASESNANLYSIEALDYSNVALESKEQAEQFRNETIVAKNEAILAKEQAQEISDPENRIGNLQQTKSNRGEFWFQGGEFQNNTLKYSQGNPFSFAFGFRAKKSDILGVASAIYVVNLGFLFLYLPKDTKKMAFYSSGAVSVRYISDADNERLLNGEWHSLVISYDGIILKLSDETGVLLSVSATLPSQSNSSAIRIGTSLIGQMRSIKYFNFDMSSDDAPYTIADYIAGKDESPLLHGGAYNINSQSDWLAFHSNEGTFASSGNDLTFTASEDVGAGYLVFYVNADVKAGTKVEALIDSVVNNTSATISKYSISAGATSTNDAGSSPSSTTLFGKQTSFTTTKDSNKLAFWIWKTGTFATGDTLTLVNPQIKVNGALLSLEDYSFNGRVLDVSGNNNTATITGAVKGTRDNAVEQMYQAFASRIGNLTE